MHFTITASWQTNLWARPAAHPLQHFRNAPEASKLLCYAEMPESTRPEQVQSSTAVISCGVPISSFSHAQALEAVSNKSFGCTMCGKCCTLADDAEVWLNSNELLGIAKHLGISNEQVIETYLQPYQQVPGWWLLRSKTVSGPWPFDKQQQQDPGITTSGEKQQRQVCVFLDEATNACGIYPVRPLQCSTYPWWPEIMPAEHWKQEQQHVCEGIEHPDAPELDRAYAAQQLQLATEHTLSLEAAKPAGWDAEGQLYSGNSSRGL